MSSNLQNYKIGVIIDGDVKGLETATKKADTAISGLSKNVKSFITSTGANLGADALSSLTGFAKDGALEMLRYSAKIETTSVAFKNLSGNAAFAASHIKELQQFSVQNSLPLEPLLTMSQRLQAAGVQSEKLIPLMQDIGNVAAATGDLGAERLEGIATALSQMISKGKLSAEEMEQLAERNVPAWKLLSDATGKTVAELRELGEQGKLTSNDMLNALNKVATNKFGNALKEQSQTGMGAWTGMVNTIQVTSAQAFEPMYKEISQLAVKMNQEIQAQGGDLEAVGEVVMEYIGVGAGRATAAVGQAIGRELANSITFAVGLTDKPDIISSFLNNLESGFDEGLYGASKLTTAIKSVERSYADTSTVVKKLPDASKILNAGKAESESKKLKEQYQSLLGVVENLSIQAVFFGEETEVAAVKSKLLADGITNFDKGLAKVAVTWAEYLDKLKTGQKIQGEYNDNLKSAREELAEMKAEANFKLRFAEPTELARFNESIRQGKYNFRELKTEVNLTREALQRLAIFDAANNRDSSIRSLMGVFSSKNKELQATQDGTFSEMLADTFSGFGLEKAVDKAGNDLDSSAQKFGTAIDKMLGFWAGKVSEAEAAGYSFQQISDFNQDMIEKFDEFLRGFYTKVDDKVIQLFAENERGVRDFTNAIIDLQNRFVDKQFSNGIKKLDEVMDGLGFTTRNITKEFEDFDKTMSDKFVNAALEERARSYGKTAEELKSILRSSILLQGVKAPTLDDLGGRRERPEQKIQAPYLGASTEFGQGLKDGLFGISGIQKAESETEILKNLYRDLGSTVMDVFGGMTQAAESVLANYILTGEAGGQVFAQLASQVIASLAVQSGVKAIFEVAEGFAALATTWGVPNPSSIAHFAAAKIYGVVAAGAAVTGVAIGASGGLSGNKSKNKNGQNENSQERQDNRKFNFVRDQNIGSNQSQANNQLQLTVNNLQNAVQEMTVVNGQLWSRVKTQQAGVLVADGIKQNPGLVSQTVTSEMSKNSTTASNFGRVLGVG